MAKKAAAKKSAPKAAKPVKAPKINIAPFRKQLLAMRDDLMKTVRNQQISETMQNDIGDSVDEASRSIERELLFELSDNERVTLDMIEAALRKMDKGTFGLCESCRKPIMKARLDALPFARYCMPCQTGAESAPGGEIEGPNFGAIGEEPRSQAEMS
jgi:DnaK suppressor protein